MISKYTKRTWLAIALAGGITISTVAPMQVSAETSQDLIIEKKQVDAEVKALADELAKLQKELDAKIKVFEQVAAETKEVDASIAETTKRIEKRSELIAERMRAFQAKDKGVNLYVDAIFSSDSITEMMDRVTAVKTYLDADQALFNEQTEDNNKLKEQKKVLAAKKAELEKQFQALQEQEGVIEVKKAENEAKSLALKSKIATKQEEERLERERKEAEERAAQLRALQQQQMATVAAPQATTTTPQAAPQASAPIKAVGGGVGTAIAEAHKYIGMPYNWGGASPATSFDCSGLTQYSYAKAGISLPRTAAQQYLATSRVSASQAQPGDLVFFSYGSGVAHVGIYLGNNMMINSQNSGVTVEPLGSWWQQYIVGYGRP